MPLFGKKNQGFISLGTEPTKPKQKWKLSSLFKKKKKVSFSYSSEDFKGPMFDDDYEGDEEDFDDNGWEDGDYDIELKLTVLKAGAGDKLLQAKIHETKFMGKRSWSAPSKLEASLALLGGAGTLLEGIIETAVGSKSRIKQEVPMSKKRWGKFVSAQYAAIVLEPIPVLGQIGSPIAAILGSVAEGKGPANVARDAAAAELASLVDGALGTVTLGVYSACTEATGQVVAALVVLIKAHYYLSTYAETETYILLQIGQLRQAYTKADKLGISKSAYKAYASHLTWLGRQADKCGERGPQYRSLVDKVEKKFKEKLEKIGGGAAEGLVDIVEHYSTSSVPSNSPIQIVYADE